MDFDIRCTHVGGTRCHHIVVKDFKAVLRYNTDCTASHNANKGRQLWHSIIHLPVNRYHECNQDNRTRILVDRLLL